MPIESDPGLTGQVLKFVNSSYFGFSREISSVKLAITLVGIRTIKNFSLWSAVFSLMPNPKCGPFDLKSLWQDSLRRGLFARSFGKLLGLKEAEDLFAAALLQDMAVPLLAKEQPTRYLKLLETRVHRRVSPLGPGTGRVRLDPRRRRRLHGPQLEPARRVRRADRSPHRPRSPARGQLEGDRQAVGRPVGPASRHARRALARAGKVRRHLRRAVGRQREVRPTTASHRSTWNSPSSPPC